MGRPKDPNLEETFHVGLRLTKKQVTKVTKIASALRKKGMRGTVSEAIRHAIETASLAA